MYSLRCLMHLFVRVHNNQSVMNDIQQLDFLEPK